MADPVAPAAVTVSASIPAIEPFVEHQMAERVDVTVGAVDVHGQGSGGEEQPGIAGRVATGFVI